MLHFEMDLNGHMKKVILISRLYEEISSFFPNGHRTETSRSCMTIKICTKMLETILEEKKYLGARSDIISTHTGHPNPQNSLKMMDSRIKSKL